MNKFIKKCFDEMDVTGAYIMLPQVRNRAKRIREVVKDMKLKDAIPSKRIKLGKIHQMEATLAQLMNVEKKMLSIKRGKQPKSLEWKELESCFQSRIKTGIIINHKYKCPEMFLKKSFCMFKNKVSPILKMQMLKINVVVSMIYELPTKENEISIKSFATKNAEIDLTSDLRCWYATHITNPILTKIEEYQLKESGWALKSILNMKVNMCRFNPMTAGNSTFVKLPKEIINKRAVLNIENRNDNLCFLHCINAALNPCSKKGLNPIRISSYPKLDNLNIDYKNFDFPFKLNNVTKFAKLNDLNINVYTFEIVKKQLKFVPIILTKNFESKLKTIHLLIIPSNNNTFHFCLIKNLSRLVSSFLSKNKKAKYICDRCLHYFSNQELLNNHENDCRVYNMCSIEMPAENDKILKFNNFSNSNKVPIVIYADFECLLQKTNKKLPSSEFSHITKEHKPFSVGYYLKCSYDDNLSRYDSYRGRNCSEWFIKQLVGIVDDLEKKYKNILKMNLTKDNQILFDNSSTCHICKLTISKLDTKVRDHCHLTGNYRGAAHQACNLNYKNTFNIPVVFHNLSNYDSHLFIKELANLEGEQVFLLPLNDEKYISFSKKIQNSKIKLKFIDSFRFLDSSIEELASHLTESQKIILKKHFPKSQHFNLLSRKGVFPYEYVDCWKKLRENKLPPLKDFYNELHNSGISASDYEHACQVWKIFNLKTLGEYSDVYLKTDVLLLADIFENFRNTTLKSYDLDALHYVTIPSLSYDAMLKHTQIELELLTDIDMKLFIEKGIRGGISQCCHRYAKANNKYMNNFDKNKPSQFLMYFDVRNLYGYAMSQYLPFNNFRWVQKENFNKIDLKDLSQKNNVGYIFEVDLEYPIELHDSHSDLPFCAEHMVPPGSKSNEKKLLTTLFNKKKYVIHYMALKQCLEQGIKISQIHRILRFNQKPWLKSYIDLNTHLRKNAKNEFEKKLYKLFINAVFGKTMENLNKRRDVKLVSKWEGRYGAQTLISKPNFNHISIFAEDLAAIELNKTSILFNKPIYIGFSILDLAKTVVYDFHYNFICKHYKDKSKLLYTDTDSLIYSFTSFDHNENDDIYNLMFKNLDKFDTSDYPPTHKMFSLKNKAVYGKMKDECNGKVMEAFCGLRSKMYSIKYDEKEIKKSKGTNLSIVRDLTFNNYYDCLMHNSRVQKFQNNIRSQKHKIVQIKQYKIVLSPFDDKRFICSNNINTLAWGHYKID